MTNKMLSHTFASFKNKQQLSKQALQSGKHTNVECPRLATMPVCLLGKRRVSQDISCAEAAHVP